MDCTSCLDSELTGAENLVAVFQVRDAQLFGVAKNSKDAQVLLGALEIGTDGILLRTQDPSQVSLYF